MSPGTPPARPIHVYFHFRSPYCYLASKSMFAMFDSFHTELVWRPLGGYDGRSPPERAKLKIPLARQDLARHCRRMGIPCVPPSVTADATDAGVGSLLAQQRGLLRPYIIELMRAEWGAGVDLGEREALAGLAAEVGLDRAEFEAFVAAPEHRERLAMHWREAQEKGVVGVPSFVIDDQVFWGNDRIDFVLEHLTELRLARR